MHKHLKKLNLQSGKVIRRIISLQFALCMLIPEAGATGPLMLERPRIKNFTKNVYNADNQNWCVAQDNNGTLYFANSAGLLSFNGISWKLWPLPDKTILRSVEVSPDGKIFTGSYEEFGYWINDASGNLRYTSLKPLLKNFTFHNEDIWKIISFNGITYFQSFSVIFAYDGKQVETIYPPGFINCFARMGNRLLLIVADHGLYELKDQKVTLLDDSEFFRNKLIRVMLPYTGSNMLVATADEGLYIYGENRSLRKWNIPGPDDLSGCSINRGLVTPDSLYIIGTILKGVYAFDKEGRMVFHIEKKNGLQNNTVLATFLDHDGLLWLGLDNGIDLVNPSGGISYYYDLTGKLGSVYTVLIRNNFLYAGTNQGLFYSPFSEKKSAVSLDFTLIPGSQGQVWSIQEFNNQVICGHNDKTYEVSGTSITPVSPVSGGFAICALHHRSDDYLLQSTYTDLVLYHRQNGRWVFWHTIENFRNPVRYIEVDHLGNIWASHLQRGVYRIRLNDSLTRVTDCRYFGRQQGFKSDYQISVFRLQNRIVFTNEGSVYLYNDLTDSIEPFRFVQEKIGPGKKISRIIPAGDQLYWFVTDNSLDLYAFTAGNMILKKSYPFEWFDNRLIRNNENVYPIDSSHWLVCLENGFAMLSSAPDRDLLPSKKAIIGKVISTGRKEKVWIPSADEKNTVPVLGYSQNNIIFNYSCPVFDTRLIFRVKLEGLDKGWTETDQAFYKYDRLPPGSYVFRVKAIDGLGNASREGSWAFSVRSPWYWSGISKLLYLIFAITLFLVSRASFFRRLRRHEHKLSIEKERELIRLKNEKLQAEIQHKSIQLANTTYSIIKKNELLLEIKRLLSKRAGEGQGGHHFRDIRKLLDQNITDDDDWKIFESNFEQAHEEFLKRIKKQYPDLTPSDLKLCAFIRMNLSTKKIAPLLGISTRGVENHRYRLRQKMDLGRDVNLTEFLMEF